MKKMILAALAAFVMGFGFMSCGDKAQKNNAADEKAAPEKEATEQVAKDDTPEGKMLGLFSKMVTLVKETHIKSADDVKSFLSDLKDIQSKIEVLAKENEERELPKEVEEKLEDQFNKMQEELNPEMERVVKEITSLKASDLEGIDLSELGL